MARYFQEQLITSENFEWNETSNETYQGNDDFILELIPRNYELICT